MDWEVEERGLEDIRSELAAFASHGGMDGISAILRVAKDQIALRPTGAEAAVLAMDLAAWCAFAIACYRMNHNERVLLIAVRDTTLLVLFCVYHLTRYARMDLLDRSDNRIIRSEARCAITTLLTNSHIAPQPLEIGEFKLLKRLAKGQRAFRSIVKPILNLGPQPREVFPVEAEP